MLAATLEEERKKVYQEGRQEGRIETQRQMVEHLLQFRFELTIVELQRYAQQVATIQQVQPLDDLVNILLNKSATLEDFSSHLAHLLS